MSQENGQNAAPLNSNQTAATPKKTAKFFLASGVVFVAVVIAIAALAWVVAAPRGELRLAVPPSFDNEKAGASTKTAVAADLFKRVESLVDEVQEDHEWLSLADANLPTPLVQMPPRERPGGNPLQKLITGFIIETSIDQKTGRVALSIDGVALLESLYGVVGWQDFFLEISSIDKVDCEDVGDQKCYEVIAHFSPSTQRVNVVAKGQIGDLARELAVLVLRGVVFESEIAWNAENRGTGRPPPYVPASFLPTSVAALEASATGIEILLKGQRHPACSTQLNCREQAKSWFEQAVASDDGETNPIAALGLGLIAIEEGLLAAEALKPARLVESKLNEANNYMNKVRYDDFVRDRLASKSFVNQFNALRLTGAVLDEKFFERISNFVCVLDAYRRGSWGECLAQIGDLEGYPEVLIPYLEPAQLHAKLRSATDPTEKQAVMDEVRERLRAVETDTNLSRYRKGLRRWALQRIIVLDACVDPNPDISEQEFGELAEGLINYAPDREARVIAKVEVEGCMPVGNANDNGPPLENIVDQLGNDDARHRLEFALAKYYVRAGDYDLALELLKNALPLSHVGPYVRASEEFASFRDSASHGDAFFEAYYSNLAGPTELACRGGELF